MVETLMDSEECYSAINKKDSIISVLFFKTPWAMNCPAFHDVLQEMKGSGLYKPTNFMEIDAEDAPEFCYKYNVSLVPTVLIFRNTELQGRVDGFKPNSLKNKLKRLLTNSDLGVSHTSAAAPVPQSTGVELLKVLINQQDIMLFMKGDRFHPKCGFSNTIIQILNETGFPYGTFDILTNEEVRQGLKTYSNWHTYPQVYKKGELVGGLDIIKDLKESGELSSILGEQA